MKKGVIVYWSGTGSTEAMAEALAEGAKKNHAQVTLLPVDEATVDDVKNADFIAMGCPSMGGDELEEQDMEPFVASLESVVAGKPVVLFGSYGWGEGKWMEDWVARMNQWGAQVLGEGLICLGMPNEENLKECQEVGSALSEA